MQKKEKLDKGKKRLEGRCDRSATLPLSLDISEALVHRLLCFPWCSIYLAHAANPIVTTLGTGLKTSHIVLVFAGRFLPDVTCTPGCYFLQPRHELPD